MPDNPASAPEALTPYEAAEVERLARVLHAAAGKGRAWWLPWERLAERHKADRRADALEMLRHR